MIRRNWPVALVVLFVALLGWYLFYTQRIVDALSSNTQTLTQIFAVVNEGLTDPDPTSADEALVELQRLILDAGVPLVMAGPGDTILAARNLPFEADPDSRVGQALIKDYVRRLDLRNPPVGDPSVQHIHFGDPPVVRRLRWIPWLQVGGVLLAVLVGVTVVRYQLRVEGEKAWTAMARELAHQLGTPLSSLQGWLEVLRLDRDERPGDVTDAEITDAIAEDLKRLGRVSRRFELVGREPHLGPLEVRRLLADLEDYMATRLPRIGPGVELEVDVAEDLPRVQGNDVLLSWALENLVKNSVDALAGRGGTITITADADTGDRVVLQIRDTGPGVPANLRDHIFEPGVTSKSGGWGVGLTLSRRIIETVHDGRIELLDSRGPGAIFQVKLPAAEV